MYIKFKFAILLIIIMISCSSCFSRDNTANDIIVLQNIYIGNKIYNSTSKDYILKNVNPMFEDNNVTVAQMTDTNMNLINIYTLSFSKGLISSIQISIQSDETVLCGDITYNGIYIVTQSAQIVKLYIFNRDGVYLSCKEGLQEFFTINEQFNFHIDKYCVSKDGISFLSADSQNRSETVVLDKSFNYLYTLDISEHVKRLIRNDQGDIYCFSGKWYCKLSGTESPTFYSYHGIGGKWSSDIISYYPINETSWYYSTSTGIYKASNSENYINNTEVLNYVNSGIKFQNFDIFLITDDIIISTDSMYSDESSTLTLWKKTDDYTISSKQLLEIVSFDQITLSYIQPYINDYNSSHNNTRVLLYDYSQYNNSLSENQGEEKLTIDILTGILNPDIIVTKTGSNFISNIVDKHLFTDLYPEVKNDDILTTDCFFNCIFNTFTNSDNELWGITDQIQIRSWFANSSLLDYPSETWSVSQFLKYYTSIEDKNYLINSITQDNYMDMLCSANLFSHFYNDDGCDFSNPEFELLANILYHMPKDVHNLWNTELYKDGLVSLYQHYINYSVPLAWISISDIYRFIEPSCFFGNKNYFPIGFPSDYKNGNKVESDIVFILGNHVTSSHNAWIFIRDYMLNNNDYRHIPTIKNKFYQEATPYLNSNTYFSYSNLQHYYYSADETEKFQEDLEYYNNIPGIAVSFDQEDLDYITQIMDNSGFPIPTLTDILISNIIRDELSYYFCDQVPLEQCIKSIQSKVFICLSERK